MVLFSFYRVAVLGLLLCLTACAPGVKDGGSLEDASLKIENIPSEAEVSTLELNELQATGTWDSHSNHALKNLKNLKFDFPVVVNPQVEMYLSRITAKQKKTYKIWFERSGKYMPMMQAEFKKKGLPSDLVYLSMIESGYNQRAYSSAAAVGLWQFMKGTAKMYGLRVDGEVDERRDAEKSTRAAAQYLSDLYKMFGDWHLAVAAYNAGPGKVRSGLKKHGVDNFWDLAGTSHLRLETKSYVPKLIATIIVAKDLESHGFHNLSYAKPLEYDSIKVAPGTSLNAVAAISGTDLETIQELNHEINGNSTPRSQKHYMVHIPKGTVELAQSNLSRLHPVVSTKYKTHIVRRAESSSSIARKYKINMATLIQENGLGNGGKIKAGSRLHIPYKSVSYKLLPEGGAGALAASKNDLLLHTIKKGETISKIAKRYGVSSDLIVQWNDLSSVHKIRVGQQLALYVDGGHKGSGRMTPFATTRSTDTHPSAGSQNLIVVKKQKKINVVQANSATNVAHIEVGWYLVQNGDSLWTISKKFNMSASELKRMNGLNSNLIRPGSRLQVVKG